MENTGWSMGVMATMVPIKQKKRRLRGVKVDVENSFTLTKCKNYNGGYCD